MTTAILNRLAAGFERAARYYKDAGKKKHALIAEVIARGLYEASIGRER